MSLTLDRYFETNIIEDLDGKGWKVTGNSPGGIENAKEGYMNYVKAEIETYKYLKCPKCFVTCIPLIGASNVFTGTLCSCSNCGTGLSIKEDPDGTVQIAIMQ
jgi:hypothetical protein